MKMLFEIASIYGFDVKNYKERIYILHIFHSLFPARKTETVFSKYLKTGRTKHKNFPGILMSSDGEISTGGSRLSGLG
jgi:EcsC protein family